jgi:hypothetical protein
VQASVGLITKSSLIERDIDLIAPMAAKGLACAAITLTTLDGEIARTLEPRAAAPARRLRTIRTLTEAGIPVSVSVAPIIPFITEPEIERILEAARDAGAVGAHYTVLRMPWEVNPLFQQWLYAHFPDRAQRVLNRVRDMRGGKEYDSDFGKRMSGEGRLGRPDPPALHQGRQAARHGRFDRLDTSAGGRWIGKAAGKGAQLASGAPLVVPLAAQSMTSWASATVMIVAFSLFLMKETPSNLPSLLRMTLANTGGLVPSSAILFC